MLTLDVKVNGKLIATISARNLGQAPETQDKPGDFEPSQPRQYSVSITEKGKPGSTFTVTHDRRFGWQGLLNKITREIIPTILETVSADDIIEDGFGNAWSKRCPECGRNSMQVVRPGKAQCGYCG
jgi:hypothetical protein